MKKKFFITTTVPGTFEAFFMDKLTFLGKTFDVCAISSQKQELTVIGKIAGVKTHCIPMSRDISFFNDIKCMFLFIWLFLKERPNLVHGNTPKASFLSMFAAKITGISNRVYMCHGLRYEGFSGKKKWLLMQIEKLTCACASEVICVSQGLRQTLIDNKICSPNKARVIHHGSASGLDLGKFNPESNELQGSLVRTKLGIDPNDFVFIFAGRLVVDKGIIELINSFVKLNTINKNTHIVLIGWLPDKNTPDLTEKIKVINSHSNIHYLGLQKDIRPYLQSANALVLPTYREGFGMVLVEAGALGIPCIATNVTGCNEIIIDRKNGELIPPRNEQALFEKMKDWAENREKLLFMAKNARKFVTERYDRKVVLTKQLEAYLRLVK